MCGFCGVLHAMISLWSLKSSVRFLKMDVAEDASDRMWKVGWTREAGPGTRTPEGAAVLVSPWSWTQTHLGTVG